MRVLLNIDLVLDKVDEEFTLNPQEYITQILTFGTEGKCEFKIENNKVKNIFFDEDFEDEY